MIGKLDPTLEIEWYAHYWLVCLPLEPAVQPSIEYDCDDTRLLGALFVRLHVFPSLTSKMRPPAENMNKNTKS